MFQIQLVKSFRRCQRASPFCVIFNRFHYSRFFQKILAIIVNLFKNNKHLTIKAFLTQNPFTSLKSSKACKLLSQALR